MPDEMRIPLTRGMETLIDSEDYDKIKAFHWVCVGEGTRRNPHVATALKEHKREGEQRRSRKRYYMHQLILGHPSWPIHHKNGNTLDNRKENLVRRGTFEMTQIPSDVVLAYLAGIVDGEGCITASGKERPFVSISVANTYPYILEEFKTIFGGQLYRRSRKAKTHHKIGYGWTAGGIKVLPILTYLLPFLRIKRDQASVAIDLCNLQASKTPQDIQERLRLAQVLRDLNHREYDYAIEGRTWN